MKLSFAWVCCACLAVGIVIGAALERSRFGDDRTMPETKAPDQMIQVPAEQLDQWVAWSSRRGLQQDHEPWEITVSHVYINGRIWHEFQAWCSSNPVTSEDASQ